MEQWEGRVAVVCDFAGSTTGLAICKDLVEHGLTVCGLTNHDGIRAIDKLKDTLGGAKGKLIPLECDVREEGSVRPLFRWIGEQFDGIDLLINNANCMLRGLILTEDNTKDLRKIMETNIIGLCLVTREAAKLMTMRAPERKNIGHIINITSTVGQKIDACVQTRPINGLYPAGKYSAKAITECIRQELNYMDEPIKITAISPGLIDSDVIREDMCDELSKNMPALAARDVSSAILYAISVKPNVQIHEIVLKPVGDFL